MRQRGIRKRAPSAAPTRPGYTFTGWFELASGATALVSGYSPTNTESFTLYAQWSANTNSVTYNSQGGSAVTAGSFITGAEVVVDGGYHAMTI